MRIVVWKQAPVGGDAADFAGGDDALRQLIADARPFELPREESWGERVALPTHRTAGVPAFPTDLLPIPIRAWIADAARRLSVPAEMIAVPTLITLSMLAARFVRVLPLGWDDWQECPNLWDGVIARPGLKKTPAARQARSLIEGLVSRAQAEFLATDATSTARRKVLQAEIKGRQRRLDTLLQGEDRAGSDDEGDEDPRKADLIDELESDLADLEQQLAETHVQERRYVVNDATVAKLGELLIANPGGLLLQRDELGGFLSSLDKKGNEGDREFYLESWNGLDGFTVDRIQRGSQHIPRVCLSIFGTIQPGRFKAYVKAALDHGAGDDGLLQRFQLLVEPGEFPPYELIQQRPDEAARTRMIEIVERMDEHARRREENEPLTLRFDEAAQEFFNAWLINLEGRLRGDELAERPAFASYVSKEPGLLPSLAAIIHVVESCDADREIGPIPLDSAERAAGLVQYFETQARKLYGALPTPVELATAALAERIEAEEIKDGQPVREIERRHWAQLADRDSIEAALERLGELNWCRVEQTAPGPAGGRPSAVIRLHPELRQ